MRGVGRGRRETEMDGVKSLAVQGQRHGENSQMHRGDQGGGFGKMTSQEVGEGGIMNGDGEEGGTARKKGRNVGQEGDKEVHWSKFRGAEVKRFRKQRKKSIYFSYFVSLFPLI